MAKNIKNPAHRHCNDNCQSTSTSKKSTSTRPDEISKKRRYHCQYCSRCFSLNGGLVIHERIHRGDKPFICEICNSSFYDKSNLRKHHRTHEDSKMFKCKYCSREFTDQSNMRKHEILHTRSNISHSCTYCGQKCPSKQALLEHERIHTGEKPYACQHCGKAFARYGDKREHEMIHTGERPYRCDFDGCGAAFIRPHTLTVHKRSHTGEKPYKCDYCSYCFSNGQSKRIHEQLHTTTLESRRRFKCSYCDNAYTTQTDVTEHQRSHTGEMPFQCGSCGQKFKTVRSLRRHNKLALCFKVFKRHRLQGSRCAINHVEDGLIPKVAIGNNHYMQLTSNPLMGTYGISEVKDETLINHQRQHIF